MCVALPGLIVEILDRVNALVRVRVGERTHDVSAAIVADEGFEVGDWLEIHSGHALAKMTEDEAREMLDLMEELDRAHRQAIDAAFEERSPRDGEAE